MIKFDVLNKYSNSILFTANIEAKQDASKSIKLGLAVRWAIENNTDLRSADLRSADLRYSDLRSADLRYSDLRSADLRYSDLRYSDLRYSDLRYSDLRFADLRSANLHSTDLCYTNLRSANLQKIKEDFFERLDLAKTEVQGLYDYLMRGKIDGSCYEGGCCCFCGTVAKLRDEYYEKLTNGLKPKASSATERWFMGIAPGDTPANNQVSEITAEWMREFMAKNNITIPEYKIISSLDFPDVFTQKEGE